MNIDNKNDLALAPAGENLSENKESEKAGCQQRRVRPRILSFEPHGSELVMRGYNPDESGNPILSKKEVKAAIQYLQYWADDNLINLPRWNVETDKWEGDHQQEKQT